MGTNIEGAGPGDARAERIHLIARCGLAFVFAWHGLIPKLWFRNFDEKAMLLDAGISSELSDRLVTAAGVAEILLGILLLVFWRARWILWICVGGMLAATAGVVLYSPRYLEAAFNPVTLNLAVFLLGVIDAIALGPPRARVHTAPA